MLDLGHLPAPDTPAANLGHLLLIPHCGMFVPALKADLPRSVDKCEERRKAAITEIEGQNGMVMNAPGNRKSKLPGALSPKIYQRDTVSMQQRLNDVTVHS